MSSAWLDRNIPTHGSRQLGPSAAVAGVQAWKKLDTAGWQSLEAAAYFYPSVQDF